MRDQNFTEPPTYNCNNRVFFSHIIQRTDKNI